MKKRLITKTILTLALVSFFTDISSEMLYPVLPLFLKEIGFTVFSIGLLEGLADAISGFGKGYFGNISDETNRRTFFIKTGYLLSCLAKPIIGLFPTTWIVFTARTMDRFGKGMRTSPRDALLIQESEPVNRAKIFSFHRAMDTLGAIIGPLIALLILRRVPGDYTQLFLFAFIPGFIAFLFTLRLPLDKEERPGKPKYNIVHIFAFLRFWKQSNPAYKKLLIGFIFFALFNSSDLFLLLRAKDFGLSDTVIIASYIFYNVVYALTAYPVGVLADRIGNKVIYIMGLLLFSLIYFIFGQLISGIWIWVLLGAYGLFAAMNESVSKAWLSLHIPPDKKATGMGLFHTLSTLSFTIASPLTGFLWEIKGVSFTFTLIAISALLTSIYFSFVHIHEV